MGVGLCSEVRSRPILFPEEFRESSPETRNKVQYINRYKPSIKSRTISYDIKSEDLNEEYLVPCFRKIDSERKHSIDSLEDKTQSTTIECGVTHQTWPLTAENYSRDNSQRSDWMSDALEGTDYHEVDSLEIKSLPDLEKVELQNRFHRESRGAANEDKCQMIELLAQALNDSQLEFSLISSYDGDNSKCDVDTLESYV